MIRTQKADRGRRLCFLSCVIAATFDADVRPDHGAARGAGGNRRCLTGEVLTSRKDEKEAQPEIPRAMYNVDPRNDHGARRLALMA